MDKKPYIGQLDRRIDIKEKVDTVGSHGEQTNELVSVISVSAKMEDLNGKEDEDGKIRYLNSRIYTVRYYPEIFQKSNRLVVLENDIKYDVSHVQEVGRKHFLKIYCRNYE
jgi:head-tail adaptor